MTDGNTNASHRKTETQPPARNVSVHVGNGRRHVEIAGAGFAGLTAAVAFAQRGWSVQVHERDSELRTAGAGIYIYENGLRIFEALGVYDRIVGSAHAGYKREMRDDKGNLIHALDLQANPASRVYSIVRQQCIDGLADAARAAGAVLRTNSEAVGATAEGELLLADGERLAADLIVGADGINSPVRDALGLLRKRRQLVDGCTRILIDRLPEECETEAGRTYSEYWSGTRRILYTPCSDSQLYLALTMLNRDHKARQVPVDATLWSDSFPHLSSVIERIGDRGRWDAFEVVKVKRWSRGRAALIGDAAHALPPNLGQGGGCAMMNGLSLAEIVNQHDDVLEGLADWEARERPLTEHTQRYSLLYGLPTTWPPKLRAWAFALAGRNRWLLKQRLRTASHIPTGT